MRKYDEDEKNYDEDEENNHDNVDNDKWHTIRVNDEKTWRWGWEKLW